MANFKQTQKLIMQVVMGADAAPESTIANGLEVTTDSNVDHAAGSENELTDVAGASLSPRGTITGTLAGNTSINGYLKSTDGVNEPAIGKLMRTSGMSQNTGVELELSAAISTLTLRDTITGSVSSASGVISAVDGTKIFVKSDDTFQVGDEIESGITITAVNTNLVFIYNPDSESDDVASIFMHNESNVTGITNARTNISFSAESGAIPKFSVTGLGQADVINRTMAVPAITYEDSKPAVFKDSAMTITWDEGSYTPVNSSIEWNLGAAPSLVNDSVNSTGIDSVVNTSRSESGGSMSIYMDDYDTFDAQALKNADKKFDVAYRIGNGEDSRTIYINQRVQFGQLSAGDTNGLIGLTIPLKGVGTNDDETIIVFK